MMEIALETVNSNIFDDWDGFIAFPARETTKGIFIGSIQWVGNKVLTVLAVFEYTFFCHIALNRTIVLSELPNENAIILFNSSNRDLCSLDKKLSRSQES